MCFCSICTLSLLCGLTALTDGYAHYNVAIETDTFISGISVPLKILIWCSKWGLNLIYWWWMKLVKGWVPLRRKERLYLQREACYWLQKSTKGPMTYYALFTFSRLCQTQHEGFLQAEECHIYIDIYMHTHTYI